MGEKPDCSCAGPDVSRSVGVIMFAMVFMVQVLLSPMYVNELM